MCFKGPPLVPSCKGSKDGKDNGVKDVAFQLWRCGMVWDGALTCKAGRNYLVENGFAVKYEGVQALTGKGKIAFLLSPTIWLSAFRRWRLSKKNPFIATPKEMRRAFD